MIRWRIVCGTSPRGPHTVYAQTLARLIVDVGRDPVPPVAEPSGADLTASPRGHFSHQPLAGSSVSQ